MRPRDLRKLINNHIIKGTCVLSLKNNFNQPQ